MSEDLTFSFQHFYFEPKSEGQQRRLVFHGSQVSDDWARSGRWDPPGSILPFPLSLLAEAPLPDLWLLFPWSEVLDLHNPDTHKHSYNYGFLIPLLCSLQEMLSPRLQIFVEHLVTWFHVSTYLDLCLCRTPPQAWTTWSICPPAGRHWVGTRLL